MSLAARLRLAIAALVALTALLAWVLAGRVVLRPFADSVFEAFVDQAVFVAEEVERGVPAPLLGERMRLEVTRSPAPPPSQPGWRVGERDGRDVWFRPGPLNVVYVESGPGWVTVHRELDLERPGRRLAGAMLVGAGVLIGIASWLASEATRPVRATTRAMATIAAGDLSHRLPVEGPYELREVAASFNAMADRVDAMVRAEKQLIAGVSHELRTPLARLRLQLELLSDTGADPARLADMEADVGELDALIGELVELSRLELGKRPLRREEVDLRALAAEAVSAAPEGPDYAVEGSGVANVDRGLALRAVGNLLSNAARYTPAGTPVTVTVSPTGLVVEDQGAGVPEAELALLFEPFWRGEESRSKVTGGLGLGLMIVRQVAAAHGGRVAATNRPGGGLRVELRLVG